MSEVPTVDTLNRAFWDELCGSVLARQLGVTDASGASLARFDRAYLRFYPYLLQHLPLRGIAGRCVVEIGLGYGTVAQLMMEAGARYFGIDLARGPVSMVNHRASLLGRERCSVQASALALPLSEGSVDAVVSIGCFHHTGDLQRAVDEAYRILRPGGVASVMLYNQFSYRQWFRWPRATARVWLAHVRGRHGTPQAGDVAQRARYDAARDGTPAPQAVFVSTAQACGIFRRFASVVITKENNANILHLLPRRWFLSTVGRTAGLDLYIHATK